MLVITMTNINNRSMCQIYIEYIFRNGLLDEKMFIAQPLSFEVKNQESKVY